MRYLKHYEELGPWFDPVVDKPNFLFTIRDLEIYFDENPLHHYRASEDFIREHLIGKNLRLLTAGVYMRKEQPLLNIKHPNPDVYYLYFTKKNNCSVVGANVNIGVYDEVSEEATKILQEIQKRNREKRFDL